MHLYKRKRRIQKEIGPDVQFESLRAGLNPLRDSGGIEFLYARTREGDRRWSNLVQYLRFMQVERPDTLLIGEAPGYRGTSISGVPFLSEGMIKHRRLNNLRLPFDEYSQSSMFDQSSGFEATSTVMWDVLDTYSSLKLPLLWAVFPNHPYNIGDIKSNRKPTKSEISAYYHVTDILLQMYKIKYIVAIGNVAYDTLTGNTDYRVMKLRHPARGGAKKFKEGFIEFVEKTHDSRQ